MTSMLYFLLRPLRERGHKSESYSLGQDVPVREMGKHGGREMEPESAS